MNISLQAQSDHSILIEKWEILYPYNLNIYQNFPRKVVWNDGDELRSVSTLNTNKYNTDEYKFSITVARKIDISDLPWKTDADVPEKYPPSNGEKDRGLYVRVDDESALSLFEKGVRKKPSMNIYEIYDQLKDGWLQSDNRMAPVMLNEKSKTAKQMILFDEQLFCDVIMSQRWDHHVIIPRMKQIPFYFFKSKEEANKSIHFNMIFHNKAHRPTDQGVIFHLSLKFDDE